MEHCQLVGSAQNDSLSPELWCRLQFSDWNTLNLGEPTFRRIVYLIHELCSSCRLGSSELAKMIASAEVEVRQRVCDAICSKMDLRFADNSLIGLAAPHS
jgi:hypothetical protein